MRSPTLAVCLLLTAASAAAQTVTIDTQNTTVTPDMQVLDLHVVGRVKIAPLPAPMPTGAKAYAHQWPGVYFESAFSGDRVVLKFEDTANEYRLLIDELKPIILGQLGRAEVTISSLKAGPHHLRLEKVTESIGKVGAFDGFYIPIGETPLPVTARARQIEFIGDSGMTGYGMRSAVRQCTQETIRLTSDTQDAYPALTAKHFDADFQVNAISGRGLVRNFGGFAPEVAMSLVYPYTLADQKTEVYSDPAWRPQIIVIGLMADFATDAKPGEKWKNINELVTDYGKTYGDFIAELHQRSPTAAITIWWPADNQISDPNVLNVFKAAQQAIRDAAQKAGVATIDFLVMTKDPGFERTACDGHASLGDSQKMATWLIGYLDAHAELWQAK